MQWSDAKYVRMPNGIRVQCIVGFASEPFETPRPWAEVIETLVNVEGPLSVEAGEWLENALRAMDPGAWASLPDEASIEALESARK